MAALTRGLAQSLLAEGDAHGVEAQSAHLGQQLLVVARPQALRDERGRLESQPSVSVSVIVVSRRVRE